jgi:hypothetical protein
MTVWLKIKIRSESSEVVTCAMANTGFEGLGADIMLPMDLAKRLGLWPPENADIYAVRTASGVAPIYRLRNYVEVEIMVNDRSVSPVELTPIISDAMEYVLLSDKALSALGIIIISAGEGLWCLRGELGSAIRVSCQPP